MTFPFPKEDVVFTYENPMFLTPLWRTIFQEAMRNNHFIFPPQVPLLYERQRSLTLNKYDYSQFEETIPLLLKAQNLKDVNDALKDLNQLELVHIFHLYLRVIQEWKLRLHSGLN